MGRLPPYNNFGYFGRLRLLLKEGMPERITPGWLKQRGVPGYMADRVPYDLKFLGLCREDGAPTERLNWLLLEGEEYRERMKEILKDAYKDYFDLEELPRLSREELLWRIKSHTGCADTTARACLSFLQSLACEAGLYGIGETGEKPQEGIEDKGALQLKKALLAKLPHFDDSWKPHEVIRVLELFARFLRELEEGSHP